MAATPPTAPPESAREHLLLSALLAQRAVDQAAAATNIVTQARALVQHQMSAAVLGARAVADMLDEQGVTVAPDAEINPAAFTTDAGIFAQMVRDTEDFDRLVRSLVQDAARAAETVSVTVRQDVGWVRQLNLPSCSRCVALAGRVYRYSDGFMRHPGDDCTTIPVRAGDTTLVPDPVELANAGQVRGLSKDDVRALNDGADFNQVVNVRRRAAGLTQSGRVLARSNRLTPAGIYRIAADRNEAVALLTRAGYVL